MKKVFLTLSLLIILSGCISAEARVADKIYQTFFQDLTRAGIVKLTPDSRTIIDNDEVETIKKEMKRINIIREYSSDAAIGGNFKGDYRLVFIHTKSTVKKGFPLGLLYSTKGKTMIARRYDLFPEVKEKNFPMIKVYEFRIPEKVVSILKRHEEMLPKEGLFINSWSYDYK